MPPGGTPTHIPSHGVPDSLSLLLQGPPVRTQPPRPGPSHVPRRPLPASGEHGRASPANPQPDPAWTLAAGPQSPDGGISSAGPTGHSLLKCSGQRRWPLRCHLPPRTRTQGDPTFRREVIDQRWPIPAGPLLTQALDPPPSLSQRPPAHPPCTPQGAAREEDSALITCPGKKPRFNSQ